MFTHCDFLMALYQDAPVEMADPELRTKEFSTGETHAVVVSRIGDKEAPVEGK